MVPVEWVTQGVGGYPSGPPPAIELGALVLSDATIHAFTYALKGLVAAGVVEALPFLFLDAPIGKVVTHSLLHPYFFFRVSEDGGLTPIWEATARRNGRTEGLETLNQTLMRGLPYCCWVFGGRVHISASIPLMSLFKTVLLWKPSLYLSCAGRGFTPWLAC